MTSIEKDEFGYPVVPSSFVVEEVPIQPRVGGIQGILTEEQMEEAVRLLSSTVNLGMLHYHLEQLIYFLYFGRV
jgi:hypothetical protein